MTTAEEMVKDKGGDIICVPPSSTIREALAVMVERRVGAVLVKEGEEIVGIWTERDLMRNTLAADFDPSTARIGDFMIAPIRSAPTPTRCTT